MAHRHLLDSLQSRARAVFLAAAFACALFAPLPAVAAAQQDAPESGHTPAGQDVSAAGAAAEDSALAIDRGALGDVRLGLTIGSDAPTAPDAANPAPDAAGPNPAGATAPNASNAATADPAIAPVPSSLAAAPDAQVLASATLPESHTIQQIRTFVLAHDFDPYAAATYSAQPATPNTPGAISAQTQREALNALNAFRYIAGVPANVTTDATYIKYSQASALVNATNGVLTHYPEKPTGTSDEVYALGYQGSSNGNIASGFRGPTSTVFAYMDDEDSTNIDRVGHRRWCLDPYMEKTGFGHVFRYSAMYATDGLVRGIAQDGYVAWPARNTPTAFFDAQTPWSLSVPYGALSSNVQVTLKRASDGKQWTFSSGSAADGYFAYSSSLIGGMPAVIFRPNGVGAYHAGDVFNVAVRDASTGANYSYTVTFFDLIVPNVIKVLRASGSANVAAGSQITLTYGADPVALQARVESALKLSTGMQNLFVQGITPDLFSWSSSDTSVVALSGKDSYGTVSDIVATPGKVGTATITACYGSTAVLSFKVKVNPRAIAQSNIGAIANQTYTGTARTPNVVVTVGGKTLAKGKDYTLSFADNTALGTATATVQGIGNYTGRVSKTFQIVSPGATWYRLWGNSKYDTMRKVAGDRYGWASGSGGTVVVATANGYWDALAAAGVAGLFGAPVLITDKDALPAQTKAELQRIKPTRIILAGGPKAVTAKVANAIRTATGVVPQRTYGTTATDTAAALARKFFPKGTTDTAILATSKGFHDALSASPVAYAKHYPVLLAENKNTVSKNTLATLKACGITKVIIVGGTSVVNTPVETTLKKNGVSVAERLWGKTLYDTSRAIANWGINNGMKADRMGVATSYDYPDALCGAALCGKNNAVLVIADAKNWQNTSVSKANKTRILRAYVFGGYKVVSNPVLEKFKASTK